MPNYLKFGYALLFASIMVSCSSTKILLETNYADKKIDKGSLAIQIIDSNPDIYYSGNLKPEFGDGDPAQLIMNFFKKQLPEDIKGQTTIKDIRVVECNSIAYNLKSVDVWREGFIFKHKEQVDIKVPEENSKFQCSEFNPEYVLIINNLKIGTEFKTSAPVMGANGMMMGGSSSKSLNYISDFSLWDNINGRLISYGHIERKASNFFPIITIDTWKRVSEYFVDGIFENSPFRNNFY